MRRKPYYSPRDPDNPSVSTISMDDSDNSGNYFDYGYSEKIATKNNNINDYSKLISTSFKQMRTVLICIFIIFFTPSCAGTFVEEPPEPSLPATSFNRISSSVRESLPTLVFTKYQRQSEYKSSVIGENGTDEAMRFVYRGVNGFLDLLQPNPFPSHLYKEEYRSMSQYVALQESFKKDYIGWVKYDQGFLITAGLCILLSIFFTIIYIFYLCCRCCCCRQAKGKPRADNRFDGCRRRAYTGIMSIFTIIMVFSVACAFVSNQYLHSSAQDIPHTAKTVLDDVRTYRDENSNRIEKLLVADYGELNRTLLSAVEKASTAVIQGVKEISGAIALDRLTTLSERAVEVLSNVLRLEQDIQSLESEARGLQSSVDTLYSDVGSQLEDCGVDTACQQAKDIFENSRTISTSLSDFATLDQIREQLEKFSKEDVEGLLSGAINEFERLKSRFETGVRDRKKELEEHLEKYGRNLTHYANTVRIELSKIRLVDLESQISENQDQYKEIELYRWIACMVICSILGLAVGLFGLGLFYGCCGKTTQLL